MKKRKIIGAALVAVLWLGLSVLAWLLPSEEISNAERRKLQQFPKLTAEALGSGKFMSEFEDFALDQFPARDTFRQLKAMFHYNVLGQADNNGIVIHEGYAVKQEYPLNEESLRYALEKFDTVFKTYLKGTNAKIYTAVVPDKGYYLPSSGYLTMDYEKLFHIIQNGMEYVNYVNLTDTLTLEDYYRTDTHWRQEKLLGAAQRLCEAMGVTTPDVTDYTITAPERPFYGVYYGQAALPMDADTMYLLNNDLLEECTTYLAQWDTKENRAAYQALFRGVYEMDALSGSDMYEVFLAGNQSLLRVENPNGAADRELIVFRDSFGSSLIPLLLQDYAVVTVVDIRYIQPAMLAFFDINWDADVLFLYSTSVWNNSSTLK